jgi:hypothetical protein
MWRGKQATKPDKRDDVATSSGEAEHGRQQQRRRQGLIDRWHERLVHG